MNEQSDNFITISIDGLESDNGHLRLEEFLGQLGDILTALNGIDRIVGQSGSPSVSYRIVNATHNSALTLRLEPVFRRNVKDPKRDLIPAVHHRFFQELDGIRNRGQVSPEVDESLLEHLRDFTLGRGTTFKSAVVSNGKARVEIDQEFETRLKRIMSEEDASYGSVEGKLDAVNIHGNYRRVWIYPVIGAERVRCDFLPGTQDQIREALGQYIRVEGFKFFRPHSHYPFRIAVREFNMIEDDKPVTLASLRGVSGGAAVGMDSVEFVRAIRDEWD